MVSVGEELSWPPHKLPPTGSSSGASGICLGLRKILEPMLRHFDLNAGLKESFLKPTLLRGSHFNLDQGANKFVSFFFSSFVK